MFLSPGAWPEAEAGAPGLDLGVGAGLDYGDAAVPGGAGARPHVVALVHEELVLDKNPPGVLELVVLLLVTPLEVVHMEEDDLDSSGDPALLLDRPELLGGGGDPLDALVEDAHLPLETPEHLPGVRLVTQPVQETLSRDNSAVCSFIAAKIGISGDKMGSCYLFRHWTEVLSCLISSSAFLSAMSLCLCWSSSLSCNVIRSVLNASDKEENLFSMSWSDKFSALKIFSILFSQITGIVLQD